MNARTHTHVGHVHTTTNVGACLFARTRLWVCLFVYSDPLLHGFLCFHCFSFVVFAVFESFCNFRYDFYCSMLFVCVCFFLFCFVRFFLFLVAALPVVLSCFVFLLRESFAVLEQCYSTAFILKVTDFLFYFTSILLFR
uniref:(northern house mosquito) hypothetical protein n=1 Tax=Culex pipiens TaxID=7175 RepID=A0A8D8AIG0_CULPI